MTTGLPGSQRTPQGPRVGWLFPGLRNYQSEWLSGDLLAGLTVWAVLVPEALAYASIAGVSPVVGLYAAPAALVLYVAFGSSRQLVVGFAEGLSAAKTYAARDHYEIDVNRELIGLGAANAAAGLASGIVVNGSLSKTAVNASAGARLQLSSLLVAALTIFTLLFLTGLFEDLPETTLAAIVIAAVVETASHSRSHTTSDRSATCFAGRETALPTYPTVQAAIRAIDPKTEV
jgi:MFS superfamily sulfate permease-like transporter